jgi:hypothetical protein
MANHKAYMHKSFPSVQENQQTAHLKHLHSDKKSHEDPNIAEHVGSNMGEI